MKSIFLWLVTIAVALEIIADVLFKYWSINSKGFLLWVGLAIYVIGTLIWAYSLKFEFLSKAITIFTVLNLVVVTLVGVFLFNEHLSLINKIGVLLGIVSVVLVQL